MRLYYFPLSANSRRALVTALHLGVDLDRVVVDLGKGEQRLPAHLARNPNGKVPVLEDGDFTLWESHAIMQYLADRTPGQDVYPEEVRARADVNRWLFWSAHHFAPAVAVLNWERVVKRFLKAGDPDPAAIARGEAMVSDLARILDEHLARHRWLAQGRLTLADLAVSAPLMSTQAAGLPVTDRTHLQRWFGQIQALDAWRQASG